MNPAQDPMAFGERVVEMLVGTSWLGVGVIVATALALYLAVLVLVRLMGLRSLSRLSSFDFTVTIAMGAVIGGTVMSTRESLLEGVLALLTLLALQRAVAYARMHWHWARRIDNPPLLLLHEGRLLEANLKRENITREEVYAALRSSGVRRLEDVDAVVMESTGMLSVLVHDPDRPLDAELLAGVERGEAG